VVTGELVIVNAEGAESPTLVTVPEPPPPQAAPVFVTTPAVEICKQLVVEAASMPVSVTVLLPASVVALTDPPDRFVAVTAFVALTAFVAFVTAVAPIPDTICAAVATVSADVPLP
jgi:hypothetical protein